MARYLLGIEQEWQLSSRARTLVVLIFSATAALLILMIAGTMLYEIATGRLDVPEKFTDQVWKLLISVVAVVGPILTAQIMRATSDRNAMKTQQVVQQSHSETQQRLRDGIGDSLAERIADRVLQKEDENWDGTERRGQDAPRQDDKAPP